MSQETPQPPGSPTPAHSPRGLLRIGLGKTPLRVDWEPPSPEELQRNLLQYEIAGMLGRGGMGAVYRARQTALDRAVAIKLLPIEESVDDDFAERFRREARAMARLEHPNIVQVFDSGTTSDGCLFFVMALVDGTTLHQAIHPSAEKGDSALTPDAALAIAAQVCDALSHAHAAGIVHRDIKPSNVMVARDGKVKVADFGIARVAEPGTGATTMTGTVMGTPNYMAPSK